MLSHRRCSFCTGEDVWFCCNCGDGPYHLGVSWSEGYTRGSSQRPILSQDTHRSPNRGSSRSSGSSTRAHQSPSQETEQLRGGEDTPYNFHFGKEASGALPPELDQALGLKDWPHLESHLELLIQQSCETKLESKYEWLQELLNIGLSLREVGQLLLEERANSPWIYFEPPQQTGLIEINPVRHIPGCPHKALVNQDLATCPENEGILPSRSQKNEVKRSLEGYCGLGGVVPSSRHMEKLIGLVDIDIPRKHAHITYSENSPWNTDEAITIRQNLMVDRLLNLAEALKGLNCAANSLQNHDICCDRFTILVHPRHASHTELIHIPLLCIADLHRALLGDQRQIRYTDSNTPACRNCRVACHSCDGQRPCTRCIVLQEICDDQDLRHGLTVGDGDEVRHGLTVSDTDDPRHRMNIIFGHGHDHGHGLDIRDRDDENRFSGRRSRRSGLRSRGSFLRPSLGDRISQSVKRVSRVASDVLSRLGLHPQSVSSNATGAGALHGEFSIACLATQVLTTGILSYVQAHVSPLEPSFLDTNIEQISLLGAQPLGSPPQIILRPIKLTCMHEMLQKHVLVFQSQQADFETTPPELHLLGTPEDILDTWGPGCYVTAPPEIDGDPNEDICGVRIAGGTIAESDHRGICHFYPATNIRASGISPRTIRQNEQVLIRASLNSRCDSTARMYDGQKNHILNKLGTHSGGWEVTQRQAGFQGGQYANLTFTQTWNKLPNSTIKKFQLSKRNPFDLVFLEAPWGLQISYCTGIAQRVRMRDVLADVIPVHLSIQLQDRERSQAWKDLKQDKIIEAFRGTTNLQEWYNDRSTKQQEFLEETMRDVLELLKFTGVERTGKVLSIAWILPQQDFRYLKIPCEDESSWAKILADSEDCATFAYFTPKCLVTESITCGTLQTDWQNKSYALSTAVSPCSDSTGQGAFLRKTGPYYMENPINRFNVCIDKSSRDTIRLLVTESKIAEKYWRRLAMKKRFICQIRERQDMDSPSRPVLVSTTGLPRKGA
ncbi:hypothetical protein IWZ00DRAFT_169250 [Phyllosticta capitalensis]